MWPLINVFNMSTKKISYYIITSLILTFLCISHTTHVEIWQKYVYINTR